MANEVNFQTWAQLPYSIQTGNPLSPQIRHAVRVILRGLPRRLTSLRGAVAAVVSATIFPGLINCGCGGGIGLLLASIFGEVSKHESRAL